MRLDECGTLSVQAGRLRDQMLTSALLRAPSRPRGCVCACAARLRCAQNQFVPAGRAPQPARVPRHLSVAVMAAAGSGASPLDDFVELIYFEKQRSALCGVHALNMALQARPP